MKTFFLLMIAILASGMLASWGLSQSSGMLLPGVLMGQGPCCSLLGLTAISRGATSVAYGDSIVLGTGATSPVNNWVSLASAFNAWTTINNGAGNYAIGDVILRKLYGDGNSPVTISESSTSLLSACVNDMKVVNTDSSQQAAYGASLALVATFLAIPDSARISARSASVVYSGTWTNGGSFAGDRKTATPGDTASFTLNGSVVYIATQFKNPSASTFSVSVDGNSSGPYVTTPGYTTPQGNTLWAQVVRIGGLSLGVHSVVVTAGTGTDGTNVLDLIYVASNANIPITPRVFVGNCTRFTPASYQSQGGSDLAVQQMNGVVQQVVDNLQSDGLYVRLVNQFLVFDPNATAVASDGIHPNDAGYAILAKLWESETSQFARGH